MKTKNRKEMDGRHIKRIELQNVGPFPYAVLDDLGLRISLTGVSNAGKSIVLEAVTGVLLGKGLDKDYLHKNPHAQKQVKEGAVAVAFYDGRRIDLNFTATTTKWALINADGTSESFSGKRDKGLTDKIQDFTGFKEVKVDSKQTLCPNIMTLGDPNFLMDDRDPMAVLTLINKYAGHGLIEDAQKLAVSETGKCTQRITSAEAELARFKTRKKELEAPKAKKEKEILTKLKKTLKEASEKAETAELLLALRSEMLTTAKEVKALKAKSKELDDILEELQTVMEGLQEREKSLAKAERLGSDLEAAHAETIRLQKEDAEAQKKVEKAADDMAAWLGAFKPDTSSFSLCQDCGCVTCKEKTK